jgi:hypothetical protein
VRRSKNPNISASPPSSRLGRIGDVHILNWESAMICLEVLLNGEVISTGGDEQGMVAFGIITGRGQDIARIYMDGARVIADADNSDLAPKLRAALQYPERPQMQSMRWLNKAIRLGDEITVRIVHRDECDPPTVKKL